MAQLSKINRSRRYLVWLFLASILILVTFQILRPKIDPNQTVFVSLEMALQVPDQVKVLSLRSQKINRISPLIKQLIHLEVLDASHNELSDLPDELWQLPHLRHVDLSHNRISSLSLAGKTTLVNFTVPQILNLSHNLISEFDLNQEQFLGLEELNLSNNFLLHFKVSASETSTVLKLDLSNNRLKDINSVFRIFGLTHLYLANNELQALNDEFSELSLIEINLARNNLEEWPSSLLSQQNLAKADLSGNELSVIPEEFVFSQNLQWLDLRFNNLHPHKLSSNEIFAERAGRKILLDHQKPSSMKDFFSQHRDFESVLELNLSNLSLQKIPSEIMFLKNLKALDLSGNKLKNLPDWFDLLPALEEIRLHRNRFENFPDILSKLNHLKKVSFGENWLTEEQMKTLSVQHSQIEF